MTQKKEVYIVHGYQASPNDHWFPWLSQRIQQAGHLSRRVMMAHSDAPDYTTWQECLKMQIPYLNENTIIIAHSLGCLAVLQYLNSQFSGQTGKIRAGIFVAGFKTPLTALPGLNSFIAETQLDSAVLQRCMPRSAQFFSSDDPLVPPPQALQFGNFIHAQLVEVAQAGHFMKSDGFQEFTQLWEMLQPLLAAE